MLETKVQTTTAMAGKEKFDGGGYANVDDLSDAGFLGKYKMPHMDAATPLVRINIDLLKKGSMNRPLSGPLTMCHKKTKKQKQKKGRRGGRGCQPHSKPLCRLEDEIYILGTF